MRSGGRQGDRGKRDHRKSDMLRRMYTTEVKDPDARFGQPRLETIISCDEFPRLPGLFSGLMKEGR